MQFKIQLTLVREDGESIEEIVLLDKNDDELEDLGLTLAESKEILSGIQQRLLAAQTQAYIKTRRCCKHCGKKHRKKGSYPITFRTLFGNVALESPRFYHCRCQPQPQKTFSLLNDLIGEHTAPELLFLETKWASLVPYGPTAQMLKDVLPVAETLNAATVRNHLHRVAEREESMLGKEEGVYIDGCPRDWGNLPRPDGPIMVGIDGGYVRNWDDKKHNFEVIVGKSVPEDTPSKYFGFVQTYDRKPKRRLYELLQSQGMQLNQQVTFLSDGGDTVRELQYYLYPFSEHLLDWFHITMRLTVLGQYLKGVVHVDEKQGHYLQRLLESIKWYLWHGNHVEALSYLGLMESVIWNIEDSYPKFKKLEKTLGEFTTYIENNVSGIVNYGERWRYGEAISTAFVESTVNVLVSKRFCKKQQMQWKPKGAHLLLQTRAAVLNDDLEHQFRKWYPSFRKQGSEEMRRAA